MTPPLDTHPTLQGPYLFRTSLTRMGVKRLKVDFMEVVEQLSQTIPRLWSLVSLQLLPALGKALWEQSL